ncbi:hypothetical protein F3087_15165 [Nocardia colli]|uniref:Uncharacterized protein n=1 Tax=Nocardia colli TaxID=2545717 RepID=A0A5N0EHR1_9NOCA|nr:hypothetical protein [Nocardia colli]KAA8888370.1 hypothetical protein F3087_15165 [Nocardia colli]
MAIARYAIPAQSSAPLDAGPPGTDVTRIRLTYLYPIADGATFAMALLGAMSGARITRSRLLAPAAIALIGSRTRPVRHLDIVILTMQAARNTQFRAVFYAQ